MTEKKQGKATKVLVASTLGAALLLGGSTYALWSSSVTPETGATIQTGTSELTKLDAGKWIDVGQTYVNPGGSEVVLADVNAFRAAPGDVLQYTQSFNLVTSGADAETNLSVTYPNDVALGVADLRDRGIAIATEIVGADGVAVAASLFAESDTINVAYVHEGATTAGGVDYTVRFTFAFDPAVTAEDTKSIQTVIENAVVSAAQIS